VLGQSNWDKANGLVRKRRNEMAKIIAYGRLNGKVQYQYGPKNFDENWDSVFKAIENIAILQKIPTSPNWAGVAKKIVPKSPRPGIMKMGAAAQETKLELLRDELVLSLMDMESMSISKETVNWLGPNDLSYKFLHFSESAEEQNTPMLEKHLVEIGMYSWGTIAQICTALASFQSETAGDGGHRSMTVHFVV